MSKRPSLGLDTVVRKSRLATKGEAVPALVHGQHSHRDHPTAGQTSGVIVASAPAPVPEPVVPEPVMAEPVVAEAAVTELKPILAAESPPPPTIAPPPVPDSALAIKPTPTPPTVVAIKPPTVPVPKPATILQPVVDGLMAALADRDRQLEQLRADLLRVEQERLRERTSASRDHDQALANLAAADATIDELRNRVSDLRSSLDQSRAEVARVVEHHAAERQALLAASNRPAAPPVATPVSPPPAATPEPAPATPEPVATPMRAAAALVPSPAGVLQSARRWLFGDEEVSPATPPSSVNQKSVTSQNKPSAYQPRAAVPQNPGPNPASARPTVIKPAGPPTAPKVLNRRPVS